MGEHHQYDWKVIHVYDDAAALADGVLADISPLRLDFHGAPLNRITMPLLSDLIRFAASGTICDRHGLVSRMGKKADLCCAAQLAQTLRAT